MPWLRSLWWSCCWRARLTANDQSALRGLGLLEAARDRLSAGLRRRKSRPDALLRALRYERALVYEGLGQRAKARAELGRLYAEDADYEDVSPSA